MAFNDLYSLSSLGRVSQMFWQRSHETYETHVARSDGLSKTPGSDAGDFSLKICPSEDIKLLMLFIFPPSPSLFQSSLLLVHSQCAFPTVLWQVTPSNHCTLPPFTAPLRVHFGQYFPFRCQLPSRTFSRISKLSPWFFFFFFCSHISWAIVSRDAWLLLCKREWWCPCLNFTLSHLSAGWSGRREAMKDRMGGALAFFPGKVRKFRGGRR